MVVSNLFQILNPNEIGHMRATEIGHLPTQSESLCFEELLGAREKRENRITGSCIEKKRNDSVKHGRPQLQFHG
jgi:hypothetical protein